MGKRQEACLGNRQSRQLEPCQLFVSLLLKETRPGLLSNVQCEVQGNAASKERHDDAAVVALNQPVPGCRLAGQRLRREIFTRDCHSLADAPPPDPRTSYATIGSP